MHNIYPLYENNICYQCSTVSDESQKGKIITRKEIFLLNTRIDGFYNNYYKPEIADIDIYFLHIEVLGTN